MMMEPLCARLDRNHFADVGDDTGKHLISLEHVDPVQAGPLCVDQRQSG